MRMTSPRRGSRDKTPCASSTTYQALGNRVPAEVLRRWGTPFSRVIQEGSTGPSPFSALPIAQHTTHRSSRSSERARRGRAVLSGGCDHPQRSDAPSKARPQRPQLEIALKHADSAYVSALHKAGVSATGYRFQACLPRSSISFLEEAVGWQEPRCQPNGAMLFTPRESSEA